MKKLSVLFIFALGLIAGPLAHDADAGRSFSGGGSRSFSSRSYSAPSRSPAPSRPQPAPSRPTPSPSRPSSPFRTPDRPPMTPPPSRPLSNSQQASSGRPKTNFDAGAGRAARVDSSRNAVVAARSRPATAYQPRSSYTTASGQSRPINVSSPSVTRLRNNYSYSVYETRTTRYTTVFGPSYTSYYHPTVVYSDPINPFFYGYMMAKMDSDQRAMWAYNHRSEIDDARYREMCAKDALLDAKIKALEARGVARDASYSPPGVDPDLQYTDDYVKAATGVDQAEADVRTAEANYRAAQAASDSYDAGYGRPASHSGFSFFGFVWGVIKCVFWATMIVAILWAIVSYIRFMRQD